MPGVALPETHEPINGRICLAEDETRCGRRVGKRRRNDVRVRFYVASFADFTKVPARVLEDNGWLNLAGRVVVALGPKPRRPEELRRFELGASGLAGQLRRTDAGTRHIYDVWAFGTDMHVALTDSVGFKGEFFTGQALGNYNGAIIQIDNGNFDPILASGGWGEIYVHWTSCLHSHFGYSIDDPLDRTLTVGLPTRNEFLFANVIWDVTKSLEIGFEVSRWETTYTAPVPDNDAMVYHTRVRLKFLRNQFA